ncbi:MAG: sensor histidine kinase [Aureliella sp.]
MWRALIGLWVTLAVAILAVVALARFWILQRSEAGVQRVEEILQAQLAPVDRTVSGVIEDYSRRLRRELAGKDLRNLEACVELGRSPLVDALIVADDQGQLRFPSLSNASTDRQTLVDEGQQVLREIFVRFPNPKRSAGSLQDSAMSQNANENLLGLKSQVTSPSQSRRVDPTPRSNVYYESLPAQSTEEAELDRNVEGQTEAQEQARAAVKRDFGWVTWYHRRGMVLGYWWNQRDQRRAMVALPRARWMADIVAALPDSAQYLKKAADGSASVEEAAVSGQLAGDILSDCIWQLVDVEGKAIYQWGNAETDLFDRIQSGEPNAELAVSPPLEGWRLRAFASESAYARLAGDDLEFPIWLAVAGITLSMLVGGLVVSFNLNRQFRLAESRVSFVNQVSHELRTPLTNIRMYADLLAREIEADCPAERDEAHRGDGDLGAQRRKIEIIQAESDRLSRLIGNVLQFARIGRSKAESNHVVQSLDAMVEEVVATFAPRFEEADFRIVLDLRTPNPRRMDTDAVEQILVNLIGNAEKYAMDGKQLSISTRGDEQNVLIDVVDNGPGIPRRLAKKVFLPFERGSNRIDAPAGTGIGLSIVKDLAVRHGGDCELLPATQGAAFRCRLVAPLE